MCLMNVLALPCERTKALPVGMGIDLCNLLDGACAMADSLAIVTDTIIQIIVFPLTDTCS